MSLTLLDWRRRVAGLYADARSLTLSDPEGALASFRKGRNDLMASHPDSPNPDARPAYWPYRPDLRFHARLNTTADSAEPPVIERSDGVPAAFARIGAVHLPVGDLDVYWLETYGGGVFLPFRDATNGTSTYGGGRYLLDTVKGADLGGDADHLVIDFNYAYHPSCYYGDEWACPLSPPSNRLPVRIEAGERAPHLARPAATF